MTISAACISVNYRDDEGSVRWAESLQSAAREIRFSFVLVDNTEGRDPAGLFARIRTAAPGALCVSAGRNLGYFGGARLGLENFVALRGWPDWVMVSNVDMQVVGGGRDFWSPLEQVAAIPDAGVVGPSIWSDLGRRDLNPRYRERPPARRIRSYKYLFRTRLLHNSYLGLSYVKHRGTALLRGAAPRPAGARALDVSERLMPEQVYAVQGSCFLFSRRFFERGGTLAYPMFLFGEELFVAETARRLALSVWYVPRMRLRHDEHAATGVFRSPEVARHVYESACYVADTFFAE